MKNPLRLFFLVSVASGAVWSAAASMSMMEELDVDFTDAKSAGEKAEWSAGVDINTQGLGFEGSGNSSRDGWIMTKPLAVGTAWRPAQSSSVNVEVAPAPHPVQLNDGTAYAPYRGAVYVRYSPDRKHWSTWQATESVAAKPGEETLEFHGTVQVPARAQQSYREQCQEYAKQDVPWKADEEAAVRWIIGRNPDFFDKELPFVGYVQVLYEFDFHGSQRLRSLKVRTGEGIGGIHQSPKDPAEYKKHEGPWRYAAP